MPDRVEDVDPAVDVPSLKAIVPQRFGFYAAVVLFAAWLSFLGYLASLTWRGL